MTHDQKRPPLDDWLNRHLGIPTAYMRLFRTLGIDGQLDPTEDNVELVMTLLHNRSAFLKALDTVLADHTAMGEYEQLLRLEPGDLTNASKRLKLMILRPYIENTERMLGIPR